MTRWSLFLQTPSSCYTTSWDSTGDSQVTLSWDDPRDSSLTGYQVLRTPEQTKLTVGSDGAANDWFGYSVAVDGDGDTIVVGAYQHDLTDGENNTLADAGAAYVFTKVGGVWSNAPVVSGTHRTETAKLTATGGATVDYFGHYWRMVADREFGPGTRRPCGGIAE